ncbi:MAG: CcmD family protein [Haliscomenobacter sp.]|jgi:hypothetical protein|nr:CcmD family protein [Haliscomenobacter sp.]MBK8657056.1 CcmD family protein [Haliscomenobacter sp.]MBP9076746.1 CcmD family protein [Haliscomenobacter sp.]
MTNLFQRSVFLFFLLLSASCLSAQTNDPDFMQSVGKIYVAVGVILAIFAVIVLFLIYLDRKLTKLENQIKDHE